MSSQFNLIELLGRITRFNRSAAEANGTQLYLTVAPGTPVQVYGDTLRLEQVLNNIVSNAVKYTENGDVAVYARPDIDPRTGTCNGIVCSVTDTGIGMEPEVMGRIFSRFEQADLAYTWRYSGAGLGLDIANELTMLMGGSIDVKSAKGEGSCFTLTVPLRTEQHVDLDTLFLSCRAPVALVCGNEERRRYWQEVLNGGTLPGAQLFTVADIVDGIGRTTDSYPDSVFIVVDARMLDTDIDEVSTLAGDFFANPYAPRILVNAPRGSREAAHTEAAYKSYRYWTTGAELDDVRIALAIAYWTLGSEPSTTEDDEELCSWMSRLRGLTVLVADDSELNRHVLSDMLAYTDVCVLEAANGADALAILSSKPLDIALLDIQMPDLTGVEVMRTHAGQKPEKPVAMIALTADTTEECRADCLKAGARSILHKPVNMKTLYHELYQIVTASDPLPSVGQGRCVSNATEQCLVDYALLRELASTGRQADYVETLVSCFKQEGRQVLHGLNHAFQLNRINDGRTLLHRLKGMSGSIGACEMATVCHNGLTLSDAELSATANQLTTALFQLHNESSMLLESFSDSY